MKITPIKTRVFQEGENLAAFIAEHVKAMPEGSVLAVTSKIVALAERRTAAPEEKDAIIARESSWQRAVQWGKITFKDGILMWNAGIDSSNAAGKIVLLPQDSFAAAAAIRSTIMQKAGMQRLGVVITDSRIMPLRRGVVAVALGYAGFRGLRDYRTQSDIFGRLIQYTQSDIADSLATAAALVMGEGSEQQPLCLIENAPVEFVDQVDRNELIIPPGDDMYGGVIRFD